MVRTAILILAFFVLTASLGRAQIEPNISLMPLPAQMQIGSGQLVIDPSFTVSITGHAEARLQRAVEIFLDHLRVQTGMTPIDMKLISSPSAKLVIESEGGSRTVQELGEDESYNLE